MATHLKTTNLRQHSLHRAPLPACPIPVVDLTSGHVNGWRSSCSLAPRLSTRRNPCKCRAVAPPQTPPHWSLGTSCEDVMQRLRETEELLNSLGAPLTPDEQRSLVKCLESAQLGVDSCLVDGLPALQDHLMAYMAMVAQTQTDDLELVEGAMLLVEQLSMALGTASGGSQKRFSGQWQMLVTSGGGWPYGRLQYVPIVEVLDISEDGRQFRLESKAGPLYTAASGEVTWHQLPNHLHYHATEFRVELLGGALSLPAPTPDNDLMVFAATPGTVLARSSLGGITLMCRPL